MTTKTIRTGYLLAALMALAMDAPMVMADPQLQRPLLENYSDYNQFLIDMAAYKKHLREQQDQPQDQTTDSSAAKPEGGDAPAPTDHGNANTDNPPRDADDEAAPPPLIVQGPEDLDNAVQAAKSFPHPSYMRTRRYNRSTAQSFRLPPLTPQDLEGSAVAGMWLSDNAMPDDVMGMDKESSVDASLKEIFRSIFATRKAEEADDQGQLEEVLVKDMGQNPKITYTPSVQIAYPFTSDGVGSIRGLVRESGTMIVTRHGETN
jgi:hypothetical protein